MLTDMMPIALTRWLCPIILLYWETEFRHDKSSPRAEVEPMKKSRFTEELIVFTLRQAEQGTSVPEVCRKLGISDATFYRRVARNTAGFPIWTEAHATACGRESQAEEASCRPEPRQGHAVGCAGKKNWRWRERDCAKGSGLWRHATEPAKSKHALPRV